MMCTAKAITNGYFPFGALMLGHRVAEVFENNPDVVGGIFGEGVEVIAYSTIVTPTSFNFDRRLDLELH